MGSACLLSKVGWEVTLLEKNEQLGGRAGQLKAKGFTFDTGPSWYLMPDVFEHFFGLLGENVHDHLELVKLSPGYRVFYKDTYLHVDIFSDFSRDRKTFEALEAGAGEKLRVYLERASYQYEIAKDRFMYKNYDSLGDFFTWKMLTQGRKLNVLSNMESYVRKFFKTDQLQKLMQYPMLFLGSDPHNTPALYNIMSHIDFSLGVYYPKGGIYTITESLARIARKNSVNLRVSSPVRRIIVKNGQATGVELESGEMMWADIIISNADIHHTEQKLLKPEYRVYGHKYWQSRSLAPSALIMYLGVKGSLPSLEHHNLLFSKDWRRNFAEIFRPRWATAKWPSDPSLYICNPSKTDPSVAPIGHENLFILVPIAPGLEYTGSELESYSDTILQTVETTMKIPSLRTRVVYKKLFCVKDFANRYHSYQGSALGLAHTLRQTSIFRPSNKSKKVKGLYYVGAGTNPGIGLPATLISAELLYKRLTSDNTTGRLQAL